jgi:anthraniloyl-CoA monooxygenase
MDINVIGGGPGGLYASLLLQKSHPDWDVSVYERDPAGNTYGWGIVFADSTLGALREVDYETHERITEEFARWDPIDVHYKGERIRCGGHSFAGLMRSDLKDVLRERCEELGVALHWEHTVENPREYAADVDLLIGADGLNSTTREAWEEGFEPRVTMGEAKFAWFGTEKPFDVFTFVFRENEHGLWRIHAYPGRNSTFIVECTEETWLNAGLDEKEEDDALAYFEDLFADHLDGHELKSKLYNWRHFPVVENRNWSHENAVLIGDAAHTAHYSVGAGTKMAMEDAIALHEGFEEYGANDIKGAVNRFEKDRRPRVEAIQDAAESSQKYFENTERYTDLEPQRFAFNLLTRSGAISYDELKIRDTDYADRFDRWFARNAENSNGFDGSGKPDATNGVKAVATPPMFQPLSLREVALPNRAVFASSPSSVGSSGNPASEQVERFARLGTTGGGLALTEPVAVSQWGRISPGTPGLYEDGHLSDWAEAVGEIHERSETVAGIELLHAGQRGATRPRSYGLDRPLPDGDAWETLSASATRYAPKLPAATAMDGDDLDRVREAYVTAAERAEAAGFDLLQLNMAHGYLLSSFLSPLTNEREDEYGGDLEERLRYPLEVFDAVRAVWPDGKPITVKLPATDYRPEGNDLDDAFTIGRALDGHGADLLTVVAGQTTSNDRPKFDSDVLADFSEQVRNELNVRTMTTNYTTATDDVNAQVGAATGDLCQWYPPDVDVNSL